MHSDIDMVDIPVLVEEKERDGLNLDVQKTM